MKECTWTFLYQTFLRTEFFLIERETFHTVSVAYKWVHSFFFFLIGSNYGICCNKVAPYLLLIHCPVVCDPYIYLCRLLGLRKTPFRLNQVLYKHKAEWHLYAINILIFVAVLIQNCEHIISWKLYLMISDKIIM